MKPTIDHNFGSVFPLYVVVMGYLLLFGGALLVIDYLVVGLCFIAVGALFSFTNNGMEFIPESKTYRGYTSYVGIKTGKWKSYGSYPDLAILRRTIARSRTSQLGVSREIGRDIFFDIFLLNKTHRVKLLINRQKGQDEAKQLAHELAEKLNVDYVAYNPVLSVKTRGMRR